MTRPSLMAVLLACGCGAPDDAGAANERSAPPPPCPGGVVTASSQHDVDDLAACTSLAGLLLHGDDIDDLAPLAGLTAESGAARLELVGTRVTDLSPLASFVVDELALDDNRLLSSLAGLQLAPHMALLELGAPGPLVDFAALAAVTSADTIGFDAAADGFSAALTSLTDAGGVFLANDLTETLSLPALETVGTLSVSNDDQEGGVVTIDLPALTSAGDVFVFGLPALTTLRLPALADVANGIVINEVPRLTALDLGALATASSVTVQAARVLEAVSLPALTSVVDFTVAGAPALGVLAPSSLASATRIVLSDLGPIGTLALDDIGPALDTLTIVRTGATSLSFAGLAQVGSALDDSSGLRIYGNRGLAAADVEAFVASLEIVGGRNKVAVNGPDQTLLDPCPFAGDGECDEVGLCVEGTDEGDCAAGQ